MTNEVCQGIRAKGLEAPAVLYRHRTVTRSIQAHLGDSSRISDN